MALMTMELSPNLRQLIDDRLESVEKKLLARGMPRSERLEVVAGLENQIFEMLAARAVEEPTRRDVFDVLSRLDPPEAYGRESAAPATTTTESRTPVRPERSEPRRSSPCWVSISGLSVGGTILLLCLALYFAGVEEEIGLLVGGVLGAIASIACGVVGIVRIRTSEGRLFGLPVAAASTMLYPAAVLAWLVVEFAAESEILVILAIGLGVVSGMAWVHVGFYRLIAIGYRGRREEPSRPRDVA